jgi:hypothetical protein
MVISLREIVIREDGLRSSGTQGRVKGLSSAAALHQLEFMRTSHGEIGRKGNTPFLNLRTRIAELPQV